VDVRDVPAVVTLASASFVFVAHFIPLALLSLATVCYSSRIPDERTIRKVIIDAGGINFDVRSFRLLFCGRMALTNEDKEWIREFVTETIVVKVEEVETKLLTAFHEWASPAGAKAKSHSAALHALDLEVEALKDRVEKLEHGKA
jgi:hypothetical protein